MYKTKWVKVDSAATLEDEIEFLISKGYEIVSVCPTSYEKYSNGMGISGVIIVYKY